MTDDLWTLSAADLARLYREGRSTPADVLDAILHRLHEVNGTLNAVVTLDRDGAFAAARSSAERWRAGKPRGPLDGVPVTIKDNIPVAGMRSTWGSRLYAEWVPERDETPVKRLREAGAVILGKTNVPEMTLQGYTSNPLFGPTRNPWDTRLTPGGSSGGAVAAVASGIGPLALATDGGGSIRRPASHGGLVGLKPTAHRVPRRHGFPPILLDLEVIGVIARTVADLALGMSTISADDPETVRQDGFGPIAPAATPSPKRILHVPTFAGAPVDPEIAASVAQAAANLRALGHEVEDGAGFDLPDALNAAWPSIAQSGLAWLVRDPAKRALLGPDILAMAESGAKLSAADHFDALHAALILRQDLSAFFRGFDLILTPTAAALPWPAETTHPPTIAGVEVGPRGSAIFTGFVNAAGLPAISVPCRSSMAGLPIGFQLVAPWGGDEALLALADAYEAAHPWRMCWERTR
jgi:aspartyl-tRNA(Asn)/glutamyl-tRNA(Gln) amidotransferase subunit A